MQDEIMQFLEKNFSKFFANKMLEGCAGTYKVSGYTRSDGQKISSYERMCGAKHLNKIF